MDILQVKNLKKYFATQKAVDDISFTLKKGSIFGLLGPNGAGKTTLIRMITGIFYPDEGQILFDGKPFDPVKNIADVGYMPEERGLYKKMKIGEQAVYLAQLKGLSKQEATEKVKQWFVKFEMQSWWSKKVEDLSKGMGQKLQFVITVLHEPRLIILDEPFSGLDPVNSNLIKDEIFNLARKGSTIIFSTHRMEQVEEICEHIILMNKGQKILDGSVPEIKQQFKENLFSIGLGDMGAGAVGQAGAGMGSAGSGNGTGQAGAVISSPAFEVVGNKDQGLVIRIREGFRPNDVLEYF
ncbi:MAG TPA: ATP-binding cassette domain-containing protein, partial [Puia sp.]|nr:ATP-binding cassette domain-containing protein [Puia sp.]